MRRGEEITDPEEDDMVSIIPDCIPFTHFMRSQALIFTGGLTEALTINNNFIASLLTCPVISISVWFMEY